MLAVRRLLVPCAVIVGKSVTEAIACGCMISVVRARVLHILARVSQTQITGVVNGRSVAMGLYQSGAGVAARKCATETIVNG